MSNPREGDREELDAARGNGEPSGLCVAMEALCGSEKLASTPLSECFRKCKWWVRDLVL